MLARRSSSPPVHVCVCAQAKPFCVHVCPNVLSSSLRSMLGHACKHIPTALPGNTPAPDRGGWPCLTWLRTYCTAPYRREDPLHLPTFQALAEALPYAKHTRSKLLCAVTRETMSDDNPPMALPNGYVYSTKVRT